MDSTTIRKSYQGLSGVLMGVHDGTQNTAELSPSDEQVAHFIEHGWIRIEGAFTQQQADEWMANLWERIGMKPDDKSTWTQWRTHLSRERIVEVKDFAPKVSAQIILQIGAF